LLPLSAPTITTALENSLDMCFSALYMHELHSKYHHGDYIDLDNVKEENDEDNQMITASSGPNRDYLNLNNVNINMKQPLLKSSSFGSSRLKINYNEEDDERENNDNAVNDDVNNTTLTNYHQQQPPNNRNRSGSNNNSNTSADSVNLKLI
jgi:hypothetical protein